MQSIITKITEPINLSDSKIWNILSILAAIVMGSLIMVMPVYAIIGLFIAIAIVFYLLIKPNYCFFLIIFTIPFADLNQHLFGSPVSISPHDLFIALCLLGIIINIIINDEKLDLATRLDFWFLILIPLYIYAGIHTTNLNKGSLVAAKFIEAVFVYYMTVYFIRSKKATISSMIKALIFTGLFQAILAILQTFTGKFGCNVMSDRGYLGYLGLGSSNVYHGTGTFDHFATLGHYLLTILMFYLPIYYFISAKKRYHKVIIGIMLFALVISYSRGALSGFLLVFIYFLGLIMKNKKKFFITLGVSALILVPFVYFLSHTNYVSTLNPRNQIWDVHFAYIKHNLDKLWLGNGLSSYEETIWGYIPRNEVPSDYTSWTAHNLYLWYIEEMGIVGLLLYFSYLLYIFFDTLINTKLKTKFLKTINMSLNLVLLAIFYGGINDHVYHEPFMIIFLMFLMGIVYAKNKKLHSEAYQ